MSNHTPGPWYVIPHPKYPQGKSRIDNKPDAPWENYGQIAYVAPQNAGLIAAAPEMLEALKAVELSYQIYDAGTMADMDDFRDWDVVFEEAREKMKEALKKVRGGK